MRVVFIAMISVGCSGGGGGRPGADAQVGGDGPRADAAADASLDAPPAGPDIVGTAVIHHVTESTTVDTAVDLGAHPITAYYEVSPGHFLSYPATASTGGFTISGVPEGAYVIGIQRTDVQGGTAYIATSLRTIDLSWSEVGRIDGVYPASGSTDLDGNLTGLEAWQAGDQLITSCENLPGPNYAFASPPSTGATTFTAANGRLITTGSTTIPLIDGTKGDQVWVVQTRAPSYSTGEYGRIVKAASSSSIVMLDVIGGTMSGALANVTQTSAAFSWRASRFAAYAPMLGSNQEYVEQAWGAYAGLVLTQYAIPLFRYDTMTTAADATPSLSYGDPYPASWKRIAYASGYIKTSNGVLPATWMAAEPLASLDGSTLQPAIAPVTGVTINGAPASTTHAGVGVSPTIAWTAPAQGTATSYDVVFWVSPNATVTLMTKSTSITVPPGVLSTGNPFMFAVRARSDAARDPAVAPFAYDDAYQYIDVVSALLTP